MHQPSRGEKKENGKGGSTPPFFLPCGTVDPFKREDVQQQVSREVRRPTVTRIVGRTSPKSSVHVHFMKQIPTESEYQMPYQT